MILPSYRPRVPRRAYFTFLLLFIEIVLFSFSAKNFTNLTNLYSILQNSLELALIAVGMTLVILLGGIDMSVGASLGVVAIVGARLIQSGAPPLLIFIVVILTGALIGFGNGSLIIFLKIPDLIATIATMYILRSLVFALLGGHWITGIPDLFGSLTRDRSLGIPNTIWILLLSYGLFSFLLSYLPWGRKIYGVGSNTYAARLEGINSNRVKICAYTILGALVGFSSIFYIGRLASVEITVGAELHIQVIAATVIGGSSVLGGRGSLLGTLAGVLFMATLRNGINLMGVSSLLERVFIGLFIIVSVMLDILSAKKKRL